MNKQTSADTNRNQQDINSHQLIGNTDKMQQESSEETWVEEQCHREINAQQDEYEREYSIQRDNALSTVWGAFQDSATAVAQLYRERSSNTFPDSGAALWLPFQTAAGTVTTLYKESCDGLKRSGEAAIQCGYQRRTRELAEWARSKKRRMIRREDLLTYLAGKPLPTLTSTHANRRSPKPEPTNANHFHHFVGNGVVAGSVFQPANVCLPQQVANVAALPPNALQHGQSVGVGVGVTLSNNNIIIPGANGNIQGHGHVHHSNHDDHDLHTFKEALVLRPRNPELFAFVANEISRHCKRPGSPIDDKMEVCHYNSKRQRFM